MHVSATQAISKETTALCIASSTSIGNFAYQVSTTISQGNATGVVFRAQSLGVYFFLISSNGAYVLGSGQYSAASNGSFKILAGGSSQAIKTGANQANLLTVIARGSTIYLYANQQYLASVNDSTSSIGSDRRFRGKYAGRSGGCRVQRYSGMAAISGGATLLL